MLLAIDAGNTNIVFALVQPATREIRARWRIATDPRRTADEYAVWLSQLLQLEGYTREDVTAVIISTVVPRHLLGSSMNPIRSINWTGYRWVATDGFNTITLDGTAYSETFDATGCSTPVTVTVAQINRITGPGDEVTEEIE